MTTYATDVFPSTEIYFENQNSSEREIATPTSPDKDKTYFCKKNIKYQIKYLGQHLERFNFQYIHLLFLICGVWCANLSQFKTFALKVVFLIQVFTFDIKMQMFEV